MKNIKAIVLCIVSTLLAAVMLCGCGISEMKDQIYSDKKDTETKEKEEQLETESQETNAVNTEGFLEIPDTEATEETDAAEEEQLQDVGDDDVYESVTGNNQNESVDDPEPEPNGVLNIEEYLTGKWVVDDRYLHQKTGNTAIYFYGTMYTMAGNEMVFGENGSYKYAVGACFGEGTYLFDNGKIRVQLSKGEPLVGEIILQVIEDGELRIAMDQYNTGELVYWKKAD